MHIGKELSQKQIDTFMIIALNGIRADAKEYWLYCIKHHEEYARDAIAYTLNLEDDYLSDDDLFSNYANKVDKILKNWENHKKSNFFPSSLKQFRMHEIISDKTKFRDDLSKAKSIIADQIYIFDDDYRMRINLFNLLAFNYYKNVKNKSPQEGKHQLELGQPDQNNDPPNYVKQIMQYLVDNESVILSKEAYNGCKRYIALVSPNQMAFKKSRNFNWKFYLEWIYQNTDGEIKPYSESAIKKAYFQI